MNKASSKILASWTAAALLSLFVVKLTAIGPVILVVSETYGWGVHSFDLVIAIPLALASLYTLNLLKPKAVKIESEKNLK